MELVLTNRILTANEDLDWGLVNKVVKPSRLNDTVMEIETELSNGPSLAHGKIKELLLNSYKDSLEGQLEIEARFFTQSLKTDDFKNGIQAFTSIKLPTFNGK